MPGPSFRQIVLLTIVSSMPALFAASAGERTKTGIVTSVDPVSMSFEMKYTNRLETVESLFTAKKIANFADIKRGVKLSVTFDESNFTVSRVFSFGPAGDEEVPHDTVKKSGTIAVANQDTDITSQCKTAPEVVLAYEAALRNPSLNNAERDRLQGELLRWQAAVQQKLERVGPDWLPAEKAAEIRQRAEGMINEAMELLLVGNDRLAFKLLSDASAVNPDSEVASFLAGWSAAQLEDDAAAVKYFRVCLQRSPDNVAVLNNLAVVELRTKKLKEAADHWIRAAALDAQNPGVAQNLGKFIAIANARILGSVPQKTIDDASRAYVKMTGADSRLRSDPKHPWVFFLPPSMGGRKKPGSADPFDSAGNMIGQGSGFVVAPGYILTNRHVAEKARGFYILDPKNAKIRHPAETVAIVPAPGPDLAILRCPDLAAPALPIRNSEAPRVASEVMATGFPRAGELGTQAKSTVGRIIALPDPQLDGVLLYDAGTDGGNSGGPVCDNYGDVVAVHAMGFKFKIDANGGVPIGDAIPFLKKRVPGFALATGRRSSKQWPDVAEAQRQSTVLICMLDAPVPVPKDVAHAEPKKPNESAPSAPGTIPAAKPAPAPLGGKPIAAASTKSKVIHRLDVDGKNKNVERILPENRRDFFSDAEIEAAIAGEGYRWAK